MKIKTSELTSAALDLAVAKCEGWEFEQDTDIIAIRNDEHRHLYSVAWQDGGPIIEREMIGVHAERGWLNNKFCDHFAAFIGNINDPWLHHYGPTPLIAAMRCYVASRLGDEVDVPDGIAT